MEPVLIIGAGPAGLTAAYELNRLGRAARIVEKDVQVGGLSRTVEYKGYRFDIGGHRFFTKSTEVRRIWDDLLGDQMLERPRLSRIYYRGRFFDYPLKPWNALAGLGPVEAVRIVASYLWTQVAPHRQERNFEEWVSNRFGRRLYEIFFRTYTEKVWGMPCTEISADWAAQRIKDLDLFKAVRNSLLGSAGGGEVITTLIDRFLYPRFGPGMMWEQCLERVCAAGVRADLETEVEWVHHRAGRVEAVTVRSAGGEPERIATDEVISSMPLALLIQRLDPPPPAEVLEAARRLRFRDFLTVVLILNREHVFPDNWIYIHEAEVAVGRVQNFKNWSPEMVPDASKTSLGLEYFVTEGDSLWAADDSTLLELGCKEMHQLGLLDPADVEDGAVVRAAKAYPVYDDAYAACIDRLRCYLSELPNLQTIGRNGLHRYNNQDHSMLAGLFAARNLEGASYDLWAINAEQEYHEGFSEKDRAATGDRLTPAAAARPALSHLIESAFARYDPVALGGALALDFALALFVASAALLLRGGEVVGPNLSLLGHFLFGYRVSWAGTLWGSAEAAIGGYLLGYFMACLLNRLIGAYETSVLRRLELAKALGP